MSGYSTVAVQRLMRAKTIRDVATQLEPPPAPLPTWDNGGVSLVPFSDETVAPFNAGEWRRVELWIGPKLRFEPKRTAQLLGTLAECVHRVVSMAFGNRGWVRFSLQFHASDEPLVLAALRGLYPDCAVNQTQQQWWAGSQIHSYYELDGQWSSARLTLPDELADSILWPVIGWLLTLCTETVGYYQCVFQRAARDATWHNHFSSLHDVAYLVRQFDSQGPLQRYPTQVPSANITSAAAELEKRAPRVSPFLAATIRYGTVGEDPGAVPPLFGAIRCDGNALTFVRRDPPPDSLIDAFFKAGATDRPGVIWNPAELAQWCHFLPAREELLLRADWPVNREDISDRMIAGEADPNGTRVGTATRLGVQHAVVIPENIRLRGMHIIGNPGSGKSTEEKEIGFQDVRRGWGVALFDGHGAAARDFVAGIPPEHRGRIVYFRPADPQFVPQFGPLIGRTGDEQIIAAKAIVAGVKNVSIGFGDRAETILTNDAIGVQSLASPALRDLLAVLRRSSPESERMVKEIIQRTEHETVRDFFSTEFRKAYKEADLAPAKHKLEKFMTGPVGRMFATRENRIDIASIIRDRQVFVADLSGLDAETRGFLGSLLLSLFTSTVTSGLIPPNASEGGFTIIADEAHEYIKADAFEKLIAEGRKFRFNLVVAHQYLAQFNREQASALLAAGTTLVGRVDHADAVILARNFQGKISAEELTQLPPFEMVGRIGTEIVRFKTLPSNDCRGPEAEEAIATVIEASRKRYYLPITKAPRPARIFTTSAGNDDDLSYAEFTNKGS